MRKKLAWLSKSLAALLRKRLAWISELPLEAKHPFPVLGNLVSFIALPAQFSAALFVFRKKIATGRARLEALTEESRNIIFSASEVALFNTLIRSDPTQAKNLEEGTNLLKARTEELAAALAQPEFKNNPEKCQKLTAFTWRYNKVTTTFGTVTTKDGAKLDTVMILPDILQNSNRPYKFTIRGVGQLNWFETEVEDAIQMAEKHQRIVIVFNYRNVGRSTGPRITHQNQLIEDFEAQHRSLVIDQKVDPRNIILYGHSFSTGIVALLAAKIHQQYHDYFNPIRTESAPVPHQRESFNFKKIAFLDRGYTSLVDAGVQMFVNRKTITIAGFLGGLFLGWLLTHSLFFTLCITLFSATIGYCCTKYCTDLIYPIAQVVFELVMGLGGITIDTTSAFSQGCRVHIAHAGVQCPQGNSRDHTLKRAALDKLHEPSTNFIVGGEATRNGHNRPISQMPVANGTPAMEALRSIIFTPAASPIAPAALPPPSEDPLLNKFAL